MAKIIEIDSINRVLSHVDDTTDVVFFDIDNTILEAADRPWPAQWANGVEKYIRTIHAPRFGLDESTQYQLIQHYIAQYINAMQAQLIESSAIDVINTLRQRQKTVLALTARPLATVECTIQQLSQVGITFSHHTLDPKHVHFDISGRSMIFQDGVLTCNGMGYKGKAACHLFDMMRIMPRRVILIDDSLDFIKEASEHMSAIGIDFIGLRYGYLDDKVNQFIFTDNLIPEDLLEIKKQTLP
jgi:hypothetical protein